MFACKEYFERRQLEQLPLLPHEPVLPNQLPSDRRGIILYGVPGVGRTRLLMHILKQGEPSRDARETKDPLPEHYCTVYLSSSDLPIRWKTLLARITKGTYEEYENRHVLTDLDTKYREAQWHSGTTTGGQTEPVADEVPDETPDETPDLLEAPEPHEPNLTKLTWLDYFHELHQRAPKFRILFLLDDLDKTTYNKPPNDYEQVSGYHLLQFAGSSPSAWIIATSSQKLHSAYGNDSFYEQFPQRPLKPLSKEDIGSALGLPDEDVVNEIYRWTGGIPHLICTLLDDYDAIAKKISPKDLRRWQAGDVRDWYEEVERVLPGSAKGALRRMAVREPYTIDEEKNQAEKRYIDYLETLGLVELTKTEGSAWSYRIRAKGLKETIKLEDAAGKEGALFPLFPFAAQKLYWLSFIAFWISLPIMITLRALSIDPLFGALLLIFPLIYGIIGLRQKIQHEG